MCAIRESPNLFVALSNWISFNSVKELSNTANITVKWENVGIRELPYSSEELSNKITELSSTFKDKLNYGHLFLNLELFNSIGKLYNSITDRCKWISALSYSTHIELSNWIGELCNSIRALSFFKWRALQFNKSTL